VLDVSGKNSLMQSIAYAQPKAFSFTPLAKNLQPDFPVTVGSRRSKIKGDWPYIFFDTPNKRPSKSLSSRIDLKSVNVSSEGSRVKLVFSGIRPSLSTTTPP
jgi:hypothetical protein